MGEVYRARDARLNRTVAVKVLSQQVSDSPDLKARFTLEAQTLASMSHPHICPVFDVGQQDGVNYLVMEYLEGQTLAERLEKGALALAEGLSVAIAIADALAMAHRQRIVHRDLKPGNVMLTKSGAKLLDFGLAKLRPGADGAELPTTAAMTSAGTILGTPQYMAPEQVEGKEADSRTDIFAFGAVMYEMFTGKKAFEGTSAASLMAAILDRDPPSMSRLQPVTPPMLERIVKKCLAKNPDDRWQSAGDLRDELRWIGEHVEPGAPAVPVLSKAKTRERIALGWAAAATLLLMALGAAVMFTRRGPPPTNIQFEVVTPSTLVPTSVTVSPNGQWIAFAASTSTGSSALYLRHLGSTTPQLLAGSEGGINPFWSPDSRYLAFAAGDRLSKIAISGGPATVICAAPGMAGGTWNSEGTIMFSSLGLLQRVSSAGGEPALVRAHDESLKETSHQAPYFLPDGRHYLYLGWSSEVSNRAIYVGSLDSAGTTRLFAGASKAVYADPGYLLYHRDGTLFAQRFDTSSLALRGDPAPVVTGVSYTVLSGIAAFDLSQTGTLVYRGGAGPAAIRQFVWLDRAGKQLGAALEPGLYTANFDVTPDGKYIAVARQNPAASQYDIWMIDGARGLPTRSTFDHALSPNGNVVFSPDGSRIAFSSERNGTRDIFEKQAIGAAVETPLLATGADEWPEDWSRDGRYLIFASNTSGVRGGDIHALPLFGDRKPFVVVESSFTEDEPRVAFDGKWLAYTSNESGTYQIYVVSFPAAGQKRQISTLGGTQPRWRRDGQELYFLAPDGTMMAVDIRTGAGIEAGVPRELFDSRVEVDPIRDQFGVTADGQRFLIQRPVAGSSTPIMVVVDWTTLLKKE